MSEFIDDAIDVFEKQIQALYTNDFEKFVLFMSPRIAKEITIEMFQKAIELYKHRPIDIDAIDRDVSKFYEEGESEEIPDKHVKLVLVGSGRTLCHVVELGGNWLIDDVYWRIHDESKIKTENTEMEDNTDEEAFPADDIKFDDSENPEVDTDEELEDEEEVEELDNDIEDDIGDE